MSEAAKTCHAAAGQLRGWSELCCDLQNQRSFNAAQQNALRSSSETNARHTASLTMLLLQMYGLPGIRWFTAETYSDQCANYDLCWATCTGTTEQARSVALWLMHSDVAKWEQDAAIN